MGPTNTCVAAVLAFACAALVSVPVDAQRVKPSDTTEGYLAQFGIEVQEHFATTDDGYILRLFRMARPGAPVVLLQHGVLASSWCWLVNTPERSAGVVLWKMGYDVWLTNSRGNTYSRNHTSLRPTFDKKFWDWSFGDMGRYDVVTNVKHILGVTQRPTLSFVGWSQGTTQMFIAAAYWQREYLARHVNLFVALSPVTYMTHQMSFLLKVVKVLRLGALVEDAFPFGFLDQAQLPTIADWFCKVTNGTLCSITVDTVCGTSHLDDPKAIESMTGHFPAGTSVKDLNHYEQFILKERFGRYDYGSAAKNIRHYAWPTPPDYHVGKLGVKTALFMGAKDDLADPLDTERLLRDLKGNDNIVFTRRYANYSHLTWMVGTSWAWFEDMAPLLAKYNPLPGSTILI